MIEALPYHSRPAWEHDEPWQCQECAQEPTCTWPGRADDCPVYLRMIGADEVFGCTNADARRAFAEQMWAERDAEARREAEG